MQIMRQSRKSRLTAVIALAALMMAFPVQHAWAAHKLVQERFGTFPMERTALAGEATARINDMTVSHNSGSNERDHDHDNDRHRDHDHDNDRHRDHDHDNDFDDDDNDFDDDHNNDFDDHNGNGDGHNGDGDGNGHNGNGHNGDGNGHNGNGHDGDGAEHNIHRGDLPGGRGLSLVQDDSISGHRNVSGRIAVNGLEDTQRVVAFLVDNEGGRAIRLGDLTEGGSTQLELRFSATADNLRDFDRVVITREPENDSDPNPSPEVLFQKVLPHE